MARIVSVSRCRAALAATLGVLVLAALAAAPANAYTYEDSVYIEESLKTFYTAPVPTYCCSSTDVRLRWVEDPPHSSRMSVNLCSNYGYYWARDFAAHSTNYHLMTTLPGNTCFVVRGYSNSGGWVRIQQLLYTA